MKNMKIIAIVLLLGCFTTKIYSQDNFSFHFGSSFPISDFGSDDLDDKDDGGAAVGLNVGLIYIYPLAESGFGIFGGIDFNYNGLKKNVKEDVVELYESMGINNPSIKFYKYINVPITAGLNYTYKVDEKIGVFVSTGLALNFLKITDMELKANRQTVTTKMDFANNIGFKIGGGILLNKKFSVSIDYLGLGTHDIKGIVTTTGFSQDIDGESKVDLLTFTFGIKF